tara:strand:- start:452 stop:1003 length:552 start_codon:yes stop_codon:yes gene_type:complete
MATTLEIVQGIHQAAANAYDGSHDERIAGEDLAKKIGLRREEGCPIKDSRVIDGFNVKVSGNELHIIYHTECTSKHAHNTSLVSDIEQNIADIVKYLKKEYKNVAEGSLSLKSPSEVDIDMQYISRQRVSIIARQSFEIGGTEAEANKPESDEKRLDKTIKDFLAMGREKAKKPSNYTAKNES